MRREFTIIRRRVGIVDLITPVRPGVVLYQLDWAPNFDAAAWTTFIQAPVQGFLDSAINRAVLHDVPNRDVVRIVFNPDTFSIPDAQHFWMRFVPVTGGGPGPAGPAGLILPDVEHGAMGMDVVSGNAPSGATIADSIRLDLPMTMGSATIRNNDPVGGNSLFVAFEENGSEYEIPGGVADEFPVMAAEGVLYVRGGGAIVKFSSVFTRSISR